MYGMQEQGLLYPFIIHHLYKNIGDFMSCFGKPHFYILLFIRFNRLLILFGKPFNK
jgi:hypothetical protein